MLNATYAEDRSLDASIVSALPFLLPDISTLPSKMLAGETQTVKITLHNPSSVALSGLQLICSKPNFISIIDESNLSGSTGNAAFKVASSLQLPRSTFLSDSLENRSLDPQASLDVTLRVRADTIGSVQLAFLFAFTATVSPV